MVGTRGLVVVSLQLMVLFLSSLPSAKVNALPVHTPPPPPHYPMPVHTPPPPPPHYQPPPINTLAVEGVIYCRCKFQGYSPSMDASPINGAVVSLKCGNDEPVLAKTDANGYFLLAKHAASIDQAAYCKLHVVYSPIHTCAAPGPNGVDFPFKFEKIVTYGPVVEGLFTTGVIMFGPSKSYMCPPNP